MLGQLLTNSFKPTHQLIPVQSTVDQYCRQLTLTPWKYDEKCWWTDSDLMGQEVPYLTDYSSPSERPVIPGEQVSSHDAQIPSVPPSAPLAAKPRLMGINGIRLALANLRSSIAKQKQILEAQSRQLDEQDQFCTTLEQLLAQLPQ
jgi:hypothetical protein